MAIKISEKARQILTEQAPAPKPPEPPKEPLLAALRLIEARDETLFIISRRNGRMRQVLDYSPSRGTLRLKNEDDGFEFESKYGPDMEKNHEPFWR